MTYSPPGIVIVGAGLAGARVATLLRQYGCTERIRLVGDEPVAPYDRPVLSKKFMTTPIGTEDFLLYEPGHFKSHDVELLLKRSVVAVDPAGRTVSLADGDELSYSTLVWCAGGRPRRLEVPGADAKDVFYLRTAADAAQIRTRIEAARRAVVIGGGFTGLEVAASLRARGLDVTVLEALPGLLTRATSRPISQFLMEAHTAKGVDIRCATTVDSIQGDRDGVSGVILGGGEVLPCDLVVVGIGIIPNAEPLAAAGATVSNGINVDERCRTSLSDIYAAGDCVNFVSRWTGGQRLRLESVQSSAAQAAVAAADIAGITPESDPVPWFWSNQGDSKFKAVGLHHQHDQQIVRHDVYAGKISVVYLHGGTVVGVDTVNNVRDYAQARKLIEQGAGLRAEDVGDIELSLNDAVR